MPSIADRTYVEDMNNPLEVLPPGGNLIFVILCVEGLRGRVSSTQLDNLAPYPCHSSGLGT